MEFMKLKLIFNTNTEGIIKIQLKEGRRVVDETDLPSTRTLTSLLLRRNQLYQNNVLNSESTQTSKNGSNSKCRQVKVSVLGLTISQDLDNMLIIAIDNLLSRNIIDRLSVKSVEIQGKMQDTAISSMIIRTVRNALQI